MSEAYGIDPYRSKYPNAKYIPKAITTIPSIETIYAPYWVLWNLKGCICSTTRGGGAL